MTAHRLVLDTLVREENGIAARCECGWASVGHFSSMAASAAFQTHVEDMTRTREASACCQGERCHCGLAAWHKVEETVFFDDPLPNRHPLTAYLCHEHFREIMGPAADVRT